MNTVILGAGESGVGAALLAKHLGHEVFVSDKGKISEKYKKELNQYGIPKEEGHHTIERIFEADQVVKSPGIPDHISLIKELESKGIPVISEIEFAARHSKAYLIGITGSNGKTTTTKLTCHLLETAGFNVSAGGNIGHSFARLVLENRHDYLVLELSSFQLDGIRDFRPDISMLLNITPDHLDRYEYKMENYIASKFRIIRNQTSSDLFIYNAQDDSILNYLKGKTVLPRKALISSNQIKDEKINIEDIWLDMSQSSLKGRHNYFNALCAVKAALYLGADVEKIKEGLNSFVNAPHRLESVAIIDEVEYINDSKATNVDAVFYALQAMKKPVIWIVGGQDKGNVYDPILPIIEEKVKAIICLGVDNQKLIETFSSQVKIMEEVQSAEEAVARAKVYGEAGDVVLLSPACASFDLFKNYKDRGDKFRTAVLNLTKAKD